MSRNKDMIYSPEQKIPIGEPVILPSGVHGIRFKWKRGNKTVSETVTLDKLHELVAKNNRPAEPPNARGSLTAAIPTLKA